MNNTLKCTYSQAVILIYRRVIFKLFFLYCLLYCLAYTYLYVGFCEQETDSATAQTGRKDLKDATVDDVVTMLEHWNLSRPFATEFAEMRIDGEMLQHAKETDFPPQFFPKAMPLHFGKLWRKIADARENGFTPNVANVTSPGELRKEDRRAVSDSNPTTTKTGSTTTTPKSETSESKPKPTPTQSFSTFWEQRYYSTTAAATTTPPKSETSEKPTPFGTLWTQRYY